MKNKEIIRERPDLLVKLSITGTRDLHAVKTIEPEIIAVRQWSCFCDGCNENGDEISSCENVSYVVQWRKRVLSSMQHPLPSAQEEIKKAHPHMK